MTTDDNDRVELSSAFDKLFPFFALESRESCSKSGIPESIQECYRGHILMVAI